MLQPLLIFLLCLDSLRAWLEWRSLRLAGNDPFPRECEGPPPIPDSVFALAVLCLAMFLSGPALELLSWMTGESLRANRSITLSGVQGALAVDLLLTAVLLAALIGTRADLRVCGLFSDRLDRQAVDGLFGFRLAFGPVIAALVLSMLLGLRTEQPEHQFLQLLVDDASWRNWAWVGLTAVVAAPLAEELLFRVLLQGWLERYVGPVSIVYSSVLFCLVHDFPDSLALGPLAAVLGWVYYQRRSYVAVVVLHGLFNAAMLLMTAVSERPEGGP